MNFTIPYDFIRTFVDILEEPSAFARDTIEDVSRIVGEYFESTSDCNSDNNICDIEPSEELDSFLGEFTVCGEAPN